MDSFAVGQRVKVTKGADEGKTGTVKSVESQSGYGCIALDQEPAQMEFPLGFRSHDVHLAPEDCEPIG